VIAQGGARADAALLRATAEVNALGDRLNAWVYETAGAWLAQGKLVGVLGGTTPCPSA